MGDMVCTGAMMKCSFGVAPSSLMVLPLNRVMTSSMPAANIMDNKPLVNILPFVMCNSQMNPMVIALTAAALGVPTPAPCIPNTLSPWTPGNPKTMIGGMPAINNESKLMCLWGGSIEISFAGQATAQT